MVKITVRKNGSYLIEGDDIQVVDWDDNQYPVPRRPFALCRCGGSSTKPFCDGTHAKKGFQASEAAPPPST